MQDRLAELRRQRALVADHLAWLDREIASAAPTATAANLLAPAAIPINTPAIAAGPPSIAPAIPPPIPAVSAVPVPEHSPTNIKQDVRRGCFLYFALAALLVVLGGGLLVWASQEYKKSHPPAPRAETPESP